MFPDIIAYDIPYESYDTYESQYNFDTEYICIYDVPFENRMQA